MNPIERKMLHIMEASDTLVIVLRQIDDTHYLVLSGNTPNLCINKYTAKQIMKDTKCHWASDCGMYDVRTMINLGGYDLYLSKYPREALVPLIDFEDNHYRVRHFLSMDEFKYRVFKLSNQIAKKIEAK